MAEDPSNTPPHPTVASWLAEDSELFDAHAASDLLASSNRTARQHFEHRTPLVCLVAAVVLLVAYGSLWLSVRNQHPYVGPSLPVIGLVYGAVIVAAVVSSTAYRRSIQGVSGASRIEDRVAALAIGLPWVSVYVFDGALKSDGFHADIVYGVFDAAAPWLVVGTALAAFNAGRRRWPTATAGFAVMAIGTTAAFFGPAGCWGVLSLAGFTGLLGLAVYQWHDLRRA